MKKKILILFALLGIIMCSCLKEYPPSEIPEKYSQFFPYYYGQKVLFKRSTDTVEVEFCLYGYIDDDCHGNGWTVRIDGDCKWVKEINHGEKENYRSSISFNYRDNKDVGYFKFYDTWGGQDIKLQDTIVLLSNYNIDNGYVKFVRNKGLVEIKYPDSYYSGETWTLIE